MVIGVGCGLMVEMLGFVVVGGGVVVKFEFEFWAFGGSDFWRFFFFKRSFLALRKGREDGREEQVRKGRRERWWLVCVCFYK